MKNKEIVERPILFSAPMVRAILDGTKTQTRRVVKPRKDLRFGCLLQPNELAGEINAGDYLNSRYGQPDNRLWVRETWQGPLLEYGGDYQKCNRGLSINDPEHCVYRATDMLDAVDDDGKELGWRPSIHMPRWASRILLEITGVRIERLQDISNEDAQAEGVVETAVFLRGVPLCNEYRYAYEDLWMKINGAGSWDANPYVWVIQFNKVPI